MRDGGNQPPVREEAQGPQSHFYFDSVSLEMVRSTPATRLPARAPIEEPLPSLEIPHSSCPGLGRNAGFPCAAALILCYAFPLRDSLCDFGLAEARRTRQDAVQQQEGQGTRPDMVA